MKAKVELEEEGVDVVVYFCVCDSKRDERLKTGEGAHGDTPSGEMFEE